MIDHAKARELALALATRESAGRGLVRMLRVDAHEPQRTALIARAMTVLGDAYVEATQRVDELVATADE